MLYKNIFLITVKEAQKYLKHTELTMGIRLEAKDSDSITWR
jgi:hypothetical protein